MSLLKWWPQVRKSSAALGIGLELLNSGERFRAIMALLLSPSEGSGDIAISLASVCPPVSCPLFNLNTLWNILMILHSYAEQVMTVSQVQK